MALHCTLIEFLESTVQGKTYRYVRKGEPRLTLHEYRCSGPLFEHFLVQRAPFSKSFDQEIAADFYQNVRCGLLHESCTKNGWIIKGKSLTGEIICAKNKFIYRNNVHNALIAFIAWYKSTLPLDTDLQAAFIRKFDALCQ